MARLESNSKMGYYPTWETTLRHLRGWISCGEATHTLDPCCGTGGALAEIAQGTHTYGIELDHNRAQSAGDILAECVEGSIFTARINPLGSMGLLFLNPPYDASDGERVEMQFLKAAHKWLAHGGVLVFIVPEHVFASERTQRWIAHRYDDLHTVRVARQDYPRFNQVILFGRKRPEGEPSPFSPVGHCINDETPRVYTVPETSGPTVFQGDPTITHDEILAHQPKLARVLREISKDTGDTTQLSPILPLRKGHMVSLLTSGVLDGTLETDRGPLIVKGFSDRVETSAVDADETHEIVRNSFSVGIRVIEEGGWYDIT
jgi:hypothetical protein